MEAPNHWNDYARRTYTPERVERDQKPVTIYIHASWAVSANLVLDAIIYNKKKYI
jgi:hypothetical protein